MLSDFDGVGKRRFIWDDSENALTFLSDNVNEKKKSKHRRRKVSIANQSKIYTPHENVILSFREVLNPNEKLVFRKHYFRKVPPNTPDVITIQDIKNLVMYLLITPVGLEFINFFHLRVVDRFLRALIMYFQSYTEIWEEMMRKYGVILTKASINPSTRDKQPMQADQMRELRCVLAREYCQLLLEYDQCIKSHHVMADTKILSKISLSEKDFRIFEPLIPIAHRVVWIALQRKYFHLIEIELQRLLKTDAYSAANRQSGMSHEMLLQEEKRILHGLKIPRNRKLFQNTPLVYQLLHEYCDFRVVSLGLINFDSKDPRVNHLKNALLLEEEKLSELGIKVGILGHPRENFDIILTPIGDEEKPKRESMGACDRITIPFQEDSQRNTSIHEKLTNVPVYGEDSEIHEIFLWSNIKREWAMYDECREEARKKWIRRELNRQSQTYADAMSIITTGDN